MAEPNHGVTPSRGGSAELTTTQNDMPSAPLRSIHRAPRFATFRAIGALVLHEMTTRYGSTALGYFQAFLEPVLTILALVAIFSVGFRDPPLGTDFSIFYASGFLPFSLSMGLSRIVSSAIRYHGKLLDYGRVTYFDALAARSILFLVTQLAVHVIIFAIILALFETRTTLDFEPIALGYTMAVAFGLGVGSLNAVLVMRLPIWGLVWGTVTRPLMLISGVIFLHDEIPDPYATWLEWNPLVHVVGAVRKGFYYGYDAVYLDPLYVLLISGVTLIAGLFFIRRFHRDFMER